jgi:cysteine-rich repeat protein
MTAITRKTVCSPRGHVAWGPLLGAALVLVASAPASGVVTQHELRITSITALTVAQQITQPAVCTAPNVCLHDEVRVPVEIDFDAGTIMIDGRAPVDENGNPIPPGGPGGILFDTQSGPAELTFAPPCENPDGCVGGEARYFGTIDQGGRIAFPSLGLDFELFGVSPISRFRAPMGTGATSDPADPGVVAEGAALDFATGAIHLAGVDFIPAPIVGTVLQLNRIRGALVPVPVPPVALKDVLRCQTAVQKNGAAYVNAAQKALARCVDALVMCEVSAETGVGGGPACVQSAVLLCNQSVASIDNAAQAMTRKIGNGCKNIGAANMLAAQGGLGFSLDKPLCDALGVNASTREGIASCMLRRMQCTVEELVARAEPRAPEVLAANGFLQFSCMPVFAPGDATGHDAAALIRCQTALSSQAARYTAIKQKKLQGCIDQVIECHLHAEEGEGGPGGGHVHDPVCVAKAQRTCDAAVRAIARAGQRRTLVTQGACSALDAAAIPALATGLGFSNLADHCLALVPPVALGSLDELLACLGASLDCSIEGAARVLKPRAAEAIPIVGLEVEGMHLNERYPCVEARCGDGLVDVGEQCDPLFPDPLCNPNCTRVACGNGNLEPGEACDDGNTTAGDGCSPTCTVEPFSCGNGIVEFFGGEVCEDADTAGGDGCNGSCQSTEVCGNGQVDTLLGEQCDDGNREFVATLTGAAEVPPVVTAATGTAAMTLNPDGTLTYDVTTSGLVGTMAHIHVGAVGVDGPVVLALDGGPTVWSGTTAPLTLEQRSQLAAGRLYVNVHTAANVDGEIRGQLGFAPGVSGDGCSADCRSNETCGNGVVDAATGEGCDDGNLASGDGCTAACQVEACGFAGSATPLGTRTFSIDPAGSKLFNSIIGLGSPVGSIDVTSGPMSLIAGAPDAGGSATVTLGGDVIVQIDIVLGGTVQCFKFEALGTTGQLHCCGGNAVGVSNTRDSNTGGIPATGGQSNGPAVQLGGIGTGGIGDLLMAFSVRETGGPTGFDCLTATYGGPARTVFWTTGEAAGRVVRPAQGGALFEFKTTGEPFDCANWTVENGPGTFVSADTALNAVPGLDAANIRKLDD